MTEVRTLSIDAAFSEATVVRWLGFDADPVVIAERYELLRRIGRGGQGTVYEAHDPEFDRKVAVKVLELGDRDEAKREGQLLAKLDHPNVVTVYDQGQADDYRYYVLQLLEGPTLREWCVDKSPEQIVVKYCEAARGLEAAHKAGLVHRDFKPSNVRIGSRGQAVVVDFGLARNLRTLEADSDERGVVAGTIAYTAPERLLGNRGDERSDQFSFCVALWEALSGTNPFGPCSEDTSPADRYQAIRAGRRGSPRGAKHVQKALEQGLALQPGDRFADIDGLVDSLTNPPKRSLGWVELVVIGLVLLAGSGLLVKLMPTTPPPPGWVGSLLTQVEAESAVVQARAGDDQAALQILENAQRRDAASREEYAIIARAGCDVAEELERQGKMEEAGVAWTVTIMLARESGDREIEALANRGFGDYLTQFVQTRSR